jgi:hypothetical protein
MNDIQKQVQQAIDRLVESGAERGLQVAAYRNGELVVDAVAGVADHETGRPLTSSRLACLSGKRLPYLRSSPLASSSSYRPWARRYI